MATPQAERPIDEAELNSFVDGELDWDRYRRVVAHLAADPVAAEFVDELFKQRRTIRELGEAYADAPENPGIAVLERELAAAIRQGRSRRRQIIVAAALALAIVGTAPQWWPDARQLIFPSTAPSTSARNIFGPDAPPLAADDAAVVWLSEQVPDHRLSRPDLESLGLAFVGSGPAGDPALPAIRLVYADAEDRQLVLILALVTDGRPAVAAVAPDGHMMLTRRHGPLLVSVVAPVDSPWLAAAVERIGLFVDPPITGGATVDAPAPDAAVTSVLDAPAAANRL